MKLRIIIGLTLALCLALTPLAGIAPAGATTTGLPEKAEVTQVESRSFQQDTRPEGLSQTELNQYIHQFNNPVGATIRSGDLSLSSQLVSGTPGGTQSYTATATFAASVVVIGVKWAASGAQPLVVLGRFWTDSGWSQWETIGDDFEENAAGDLSATEGWVVVNSTKAQVAVVMPAGSAPVSPRLEVINPGVQESDYRLADADLQLQSEFTSLSRATVPSIATGPDGQEKPDDGKTDDSGDEVKPQPEENPWTQVPAANQPVQIYQRSDWGADESQMDWTVKTAPVRSAIVHHTAGANDYTKAQVPGILRGIYRYHAVSLGWGDIGYNILVDNFGRAWQGRAGDFYTFNSKAGHASGVNGNTFGVSVLGNYSNFRPSDAALDTVARVVAYKLKPTGLDPLELETPVEKSGETIYVPVVSGHRDVGPTSCPGQAFYDYLPELRKTVAKYVQDPQNPVDTPKYVLLEQAQLAKGIPTALAGASRVETSIAIARYAFPQGSPTVYVARADNVADALAGGALTDGPIVLVYNRSESARMVAEYVAAARANTVVALGGKKAITPETLRQIAQDASVERIAGADRSATSAQIARRAAQQVPTMNVVYLAEQGKGIDALAAGSIKDGPVILVPTKGKLPAAAKSTIEEINPSRVVALGGTAAVSDSMLQQAAQGRTVGRLAGADRFNTANAISQYVYPQGNPQVYLASGKNPVDAVAGGVLSDGPILLLPNATGPMLFHGIGQEIARLQASQVTALGGASAVSPHQVRQALVAVN